MAINEGIELLDGRRLQALEKGDEGCKYLGVLEADDINHESMKKRLRKYLGRNRGA